MALFGAMLNDRLFTPDYRLPTCGRLFNLFHPFDPIACARRAAWDAFRSDRVCNRFSRDGLGMARACSYRIEPLLDARCESMEPASIVDHKTGTLRLHNKATPFATVGLRL
jgi:hypothetical protein